MPGPVATNQPTSVAINKHERLRELTANAASEIPLRSLHCGNAGTFEPVLIKLYDAKILAHSAMNRE
jgi:hypothetical protein